MARICHRLEGLPLAIELAAPLVKVFPPVALLAQLERAEGARLPLLTGGPRDQPARLRTMREAIAWSHDLLSPHEQVLLRRLAVFVGGFTLEAAQSVCGEGETAIVEGVASLVDKSLLRRTEHRAAGEPSPRFGMLETVREFGLGQLAASGEEEETRDQHAAWCLDLGEQIWRATVGGPVRQIWLDRAEAEEGNLRAALVWLEQNEARHDLSASPGRSGSSGCSAPACSRGATGWIGRWTAVDRARRGRGC